MHEAPMTGGAGAGSTARPTVLGIEASRIREVYDYGQQFADVIPLWFGEPDAVTPEFIRDAAKRSLDGGETFYSSNFGIPALREAIAGYLSGFRRLVRADEVAVTLSGVSALSLAAQALIEPGDRVIVVDPVWPNLTEIPKILSARLERFSLVFGDRGWTLDLQRLLDALAPDVRMLWINSPGNPTGFVVDRAAQAAILERCRRTGTWIVSDDVYDRLYYGDDPLSRRDDGLDVRDERIGGRDGGRGFAAARAAPSFLDLATPEDRVVSVNSFSKSWAMTGWRLGWLAAPAPLVAQLGKLIEYNTSCAPVFVQRAGIAAIEDGEPFVRETVARYREARDFVVGALRSLPRVRATPPPGAMYAFFAVEGERDSLSLAKRLVREARVGLAPGIAFGPAGEGFLRLCFASSTQRLAQAIDRLGGALAR
jgi:aspartate/methionine/tyrosine aminotransferase